MKTNLYTYSKFQLLNGMETHREGGGDDFIQVGSISLPTELMRVQFKRDIPPKNINGLIYGGSFMKILGEKYLLVSGDLSKCPKNAIYVLVKYHECNLLKKAKLVRERTDRYMYFLVEILDGGHITVFNKEKDKFYGIINRKGRPVPTGLE